MPRDYQWSFSEQHHEAMHDRIGRERKARTMLAVLEDFLPGQLDRLAVLDMGASTGIIAHELSKKVKFVAAIDIDESAVQFAAASSPRKNLEFLVGDAMALSFCDETYIPQLQPQ